MGIILFIAWGTLACTLIALMERKPESSHWDWHSRANWVRIAALLLLFAVPGVLFAHNVNKRLTRAHFNRTISEIKNIELAVTKILSDAGRSSIRDFVDPDKFATARDEYMKSAGLDRFEAEVVLYSRLCYALLQDGREVLKLSPARGDEELVLVQSFLNAEVVRQLGTSYMSELGMDGGGNSYRFYPGPWPEAMGPILFRTYRNSWDEGAPPPGVEPSERDPLTVTWQDPETGKPVVVGWPATTKRDIYIWSVSANEVSDQPRYDPTHAYAPPARQHYRPDAEGRYLGGGDDINNWDRNGTYMAFYN